MEITVTHHDEATTVLHLVGKLNMASASRLRDDVHAAVDSGHIHLIVDLSDVDFMDSTGLGAIVGSFKTVREAGGDLRIAAPSWQVNLVMGLTNMDRILPIFDDVESALAPR